MPKSDLTRPAASEPAIPGLLSRVRRILGLPDGDRKLRPRLAGFLAVLAVVSIVAGIAVIAGANREPVYYGKPVSTWIGFLGSPFHPAAQDVLTTAGDEVLPYLEKAITARETWFSRTYQASYRKLPDPLTNVLPTPQTRHFTIVRQTAVEIIPEVTANPDLGVPILLSALEHDDPVVRQQAVGSLGRFREGAAPAVPKLISLLDDPDPGMRTSVADSFRWIGPAAAEAAPALVALLSDEESRPRTFSAQTLGRIEGDPEIVVPALTEAAQSDHPRLRVHAIQSLGEYGIDARSAVPVIAEAITDPELSIRRAAAGALASIGDYPAEFETAIREAAHQDESPSVRSFATVALWRNNPDDPELTEKLVSYIRWPDDDNVRSGTLSRLFRMDPPPHQIDSVLWETLEDDYAPARRYAARILLKINPAAEPELAQYLDPAADTAPPPEIDPVREQIIEIFAKNNFDADRILPELMVLLDNPETSIAAAEGIYELDWPQGRILASFASDPRPYVKAVTFSILAENGITVRRGWAYLPELLEHSEESLRVMAAYGISRYIDRLAQSENWPSVRAALEAATSDPNERVRTIITRTLDRLDAE